MNSPKLLSLAQGLVDSTYLEQGREELFRRDSIILDLLSHRIIPAEAWDEDTIEYFLRQLSMMDSNNFIGSVGAGEREGRIFSPLVRRRHWGFGHGIGRSGEIASVQPKAAGSSLLYKLTNRMSLHALQLCGMQHMAASIVLPTATGMSLTLVLLALLQMRRRNGGAAMHTTTASTNPMGGRRKVEGGGKGGGAAAAAFPAPASVDKSGTAAAHEVESTKKTLTSSSSESSASSSSEMPSSSSPSSNSAAASSLSSTSVGDGLATACGEEGKQTHLTPPRSSSNSSSSVSSSATVNATSSVLPGTVAQTSPLYVIWSRIDQKSCFKCIGASGATPLVIELRLVGDALVTDVDAIAVAIDRVGQANVLAVLTTTSCFAPRSPDDVVAVAKLCAEKGVPHVINNAYGLISGKICHEISLASSLGRVDAVVQSTDKNFMVPVGGAIVCSPSAAVVEAVSTLYPGRASIAPILDLFVTFLSMGASTLKQLLLKRKDVAAELRKTMVKIATDHGERVLDVPANNISFAMSLSRLCERPSKEGGENSSASSPSTVSRPPSPSSIVTFSPSNRSVSYLGAMIFSRRISGSRVVEVGAKKKIDGYEFIGFGAQCNDYPCPYLTAAAAIGMTFEEVKVYGERLERCFVAYRKQSAEKL